MNKSEMPGVRACDAELVIPNLVSRMRAVVAEAFPPQDHVRPVIVGVSGGADSLCLADALHSVAEAHRLHIVVAHLDHGLRGAVAQEDALAVRRFAEARGLPCVVGRVDVAVLAQEGRVSLELAARRARYAFLAEVARNHSAQEVAVAHHADDQAETVLLRLLRGSGLRGLRGMRPRSPLPAAPQLTLVRPLLGVARAEIEAYCRARALHPRDDATNRDLHHLRNRVRHELLPLLRTYNPNIARTLARLADVLTDDWEIVETAARAALDQVATVQPGEVRLDRAAWRALPRGLQRATLRLAAEHVYGDVVELPYAVVEEARRVLNSQASRACIALTAGLRVYVERNAATMCTAANLPPACPEGV